MRTIKQYNEFNQYLMTKLKEVRAIRRQLKQLASLRVDPSLSSTLEVKTRMTSVARDISSATAAVISLERSLNNLRVAARRGKFVNNED